MRRLFAILISLSMTAICCSSCLTMLAMASAQEQENARMGRDLGEDEARLQLKTFQKISDYAALATTGNGDVVCVLTKFDRYYDGLIIYGKFVCKGTYSYTTVSGAEKHVLVYVYKDHMKELESVVQQFLKENPEVVVEGGPVSI